MYLQVCMNLYLKYKDCPFVPHACILGTVSQKVRLKGVSFCHLLQEYFGALRIALKLNDAKAVAGVFGACEAFASVFSSLGMPRRLH